MAPQCPHPRNEKNIEENRKKYNPLRGKRQPRDDKNRPLKFNKNQVYVVDVKQQRKENKKGGKDKSTSSSNPNTNSSQTVPQKDRDEVKSMLGDIKQALTAAPESTRDGLQDQMNAIAERVKNW